MRLLLQNLASITITLAISSLAPSNSFSAPLSQPLPYYGAELYKNLAGGIKDESLKSHLQAILLYPHKTTQGAYDQVVQTCTGSGCYQHVAIGYGEARIYLMGIYYLTEVDGEYAIPDMYCGGYRKASEFGSRAPGPKKVPNGNVLNTEHTWPQSLFSDDYGMQMQKSDLHHLYPTDSAMNSVRSSNEFGEVVSDSKVLRCKESRFGKPADADYDVFEPPSWHKGNVARALFYFSVHYKLPIGDRQEAVLRKWHQEDPVDDEEMRRNVAIYKRQGNRNPFIDYPELADRITDF